MGLLLGPVEHLAHRGEQARRGVGRPDDQDPARAQQVVAPAEEPGLVDLLVGLVDEVARAVVDVEQHQVVRRPRLGDGHRDVRVDDGRAGVGEDRRPVRHRAVAHPVDERLLDLDDHGPLDTDVGEHPLEREAEAEPADQDRPRVVDQVERLGGELDLAGRLEGVHHEDAVDPQLEHVGRGPGRAAAQHELAAVGLRPGDLRDAVDAHAPILPRAALRARFVGRCSPRRVVVGRGRAVLPGRPRPTVSRCTPWGGSPSSPAFPARPCASGSSATAWSSRSAPPATTGSTTTRPSAGSA